MTVELGDDDGSEPGGLLERSRLGFGGLTDGSVEDHDRQILDMPSRTENGEGQPRVRATRRRRNDERV
jgi:hypothetical protein